MMVMMLRTMLMKIVIKDVAIGKIKIMIKNVLVTRKWW